MNKRHYFTTSIPACSARSEALSKTQHKCSGLSEYHRGLDCEKRHAKWGQEREQELIPVPPTSLIKAGMKKPH